MGSARYGEAPAILDREFYRTKGMALAGFASNPAEFWDDFVQAASASALPNWQPVVSGGSINTALTTSQGGVVQFNSGGASGNFSGALSTIPLFGPRKTTRWYIAFRMAVVTAIDAQAQAACGLHDVAGAGLTNLIGVFGASSTVNFVAQYDGNRAGSFLDLGVPIDTNFHIFENYCFGDAVSRIRVDGGVEKTLTMANTVAGASDIHPWVANGTTLVTRSLQMDWVLALGPRP